MNAWFVSNCTSKCTTLTYDRCILIVLSRSISLALVFSTDKLNDRRFHSHLGDINAAANISIVEREFSNSIL